MYGYLNGRFVLFYCKYCIQTDYELSKEIGDYENETEYLSRNKQKMRLNRRHFCATIFSNVCVKLASPEESNLGTLEKGNFQLSQMIFKHLKTC